MTNSVLLEKISRWNISSRVCWIGRHGLRVGRQSPLVAGLDYWYLREIVVIYVGSDMPLYAFSLFLPTIINQVCYEFFLFISHSWIEILAWYDFISENRQCSLTSLLFQGFTATPANLLTVPVYVLACISTCTVGFLADRWGQRGYLSLCGQAF